MSSQTFSRRTGTLSNQLVRRVVLLSLIAILGLVAAVVVGLGGTLQGTQRQLDEAGSTAARAFDEFMTIIKSDLLATSSALATTRDESEVLRRALGRQSAVFELALVDPQGTVLAQRRRVGEVEPRLVEQPWLATVQAGEIYVGPVDYGEYGVPFADIAAAVTDDAGDFVATLLARVDLTALWDTVIGLRVGESGYVYITDESGQLLAYRDLQLVQRGIRLKNTPQIVAQSGINVYTGLSGETVIGSGVPLVAVPWFAVVEQPIGEALRFFTRLSVIWLGLLLVVGLLVYNTILFTRRRIASPLLLLREGVDVLRRGNLEHRIDISTRDELGALASTFNTLAAQLQEIIGTLEQRVAERTRGLQTAAEVAHAITLVLDPDELLHQVVNLARERFRFYYVGLFLLDEERKFAVLRAGTGKAGQTMVEQGHRLEVGGESMIGQCVARAEARIALDVGEDADASRFDNPLLPETRSEMALPLRSRGRVIGAMTVQSVERAAFDETDIAVMQTMADQVAVAIDNARLFAETQAALEAERRAYSELGREAWRELLRVRPDMGFISDAHGIFPAGDLWEPQMKAALRAEKTMPGGENGTALATPIKVRDQVIGVLDAYKPDGAGAWTSEEITLLETLADQLGVALESARLYEDAQQRATRERLTGEITARMRETLDMETVLQTAIREIGEALNIAEVQVRMGSGVADRSDGKERSV